MSAAEKTKYTVSEYFDLEEKSQEKYEYHNGYLVAMSGGTARHSKIAMNTGFALDRKLDGKNCIVFNNDLKLYVEELGNYYYPDGMVICGDSEADDSTSKSNPTLIIEVLSKSTAEYDRGEKFRAYRSIDSLQEYVLISQDKPLIEIFFKNEYGFFQLHEASGMDASIKLQSVDIEISLAEIYRNVVFDEEYKSPT